jgi:hypothetical protein
MAGVTVQRHKGSRGIHVEPCCLENVVEVPGFVDRSSTRLLCPSVVLRQNEGSFVARLCPLDGKWIANVIGLMLDP